MASGTNDTRYSTQNIQNRVFDDIAGVSRTTLFPANAKRIIDSSTANITYVGVAASGTATSTIAWFIEKIDSSVTSTTTITHATDAWDNRATTAVYT